MIALFVRVVLVGVGAIAELFIAPDALNFPVIQGVVAILVLTGMVFVLALWPASWTRFLNRKDS